MRKYKVLKQKLYDERLFELQDIETGEKFNVDFYTNGEFTPPVGADETPEKWQAWLKTFEGKILELEYIQPHGSFFFSGGVNRIISNETHTQ